MSKLPCFRRRTAAAAAAKAANRIRLGQWLGVRRIDAALAATSMDPATSDDTARYTLDRATLFQNLPPLVNHPVRLAQVRLVRPYLATAAHDRLLYLLLLGHPAHGIWLAAPFGRYPTAAVPGEIERPSAPLPLRVVCLWNVRRLPERWLRQCLFATALSSVERQNLAAALRALKRGTPLPPPLRPHAGPPLLHPLDPRYDYLEEERAALESLATGRRISDNSPSAFSSATNEAWVPSALPMAAEWANGYGSQRYYDTADGVRRLRMLARFPSQTWLAQALDSQGNVTSAFDGWHLTGEGLLCEPLRGGETVVPAYGVDAPLQLVSPDGHTQMLTEEK